MIKEGPLRLSTLIRGVGRGGGPPPRYSKSFRGEVYFSKNYAETRKYNIDLQIYRIDFIVNRNTGLYLSGSAGSIILETGVVQARCEKRLGESGGMLPWNIFEFF